MSNLKIFITIAGLFFLLFCRPAAAEIEPEDLSEPAAPWGLRFIELSDDEDYNPLKRPEQLKAVNFSGYNFDLFLALFLEDPAFQMSFTKFPLRYRVIYGDGESDDEVTERPVSYLHRTEEQEQWQPLILNRQQRMASGSTLFTEAISPQIIRASLRKNDAGLRTDYIFVWDGCWFLAEIEEYEQGES